jgi:2-haloacid dehalogenase
MGRKFGFSPAEGELHTFSRSVERWPPFDDSTEALRLLKKNYRLAILSNIDNDLFAHSARLLRVEFDFVFTAEDIRSYKPALASFEYALKRLPVPADRILHVAQSLFHDIGPAAQMGLHSVWIDRRRGTPGSGATPHAEARPDAEYPDLMSFAEEACRGTQ